MHMLSLILAAEVYHCWEIFNMKHMRHEARRFPRSRGGFRTSGTCAAGPVPSEPARPTKGPSALLMGSLMALVAHSSPENPIRNLESKTFSCHSEPFGYWKELNVAKSVLTGSKRKRCWAPAAPSGFQTVEQKN